MFGKLLDSVVSEAEEFIKNPVKATIDSLTSPLRNGLEVIDGLTEGELRLQAAAKLGTDIAVGMSVSELLDWYNS